MRSGSPALQDGFSPQGPDFRVSFKCNDVKGLAATTARRSAVKYGPCAAAGSGRPAPLPRLLLLRSSHHLGVLHSEAGVDLAHNHQVRDGLRGEGRRGTGRTNE